MRCTVLLLLLLSLVSLALAQWTHPPSLSFTISTPSHPVSADSLQIQISLTNTGHKPLILLRDPRGPLTQLQTHVFDIIKTDDGRRPLFTGAAVRYNPDAALAARTSHPWEWLDLQPGESFSAIHDLAGVYNFTVSGPGIYTISLTQRSFLYLTPDDTLDEVIAIPLADVDNTLRIEGALESFRLLQKLGSRNSLRSSDDKERSKLRKRANFVSCNSTQQTAVNSATQAAQTLVANSLSDLSASPSGSTRYVRWFGVFTSARFSKVSSAYNNLNNKFSTWTYICNCTDSGSYGFVFPSNYGRVNLCPLFWTAGSTGANSKADTLVHEGTHFLQVIGTEDHVYGLNNSLTLARTSPDRAILNADNYAYFSVNPTVTT